ncbi:hypothetical protein QWY77_00360 [Thalassotalea ponticola]|uniref:DUF6942 family protein n=1 Tax=Thalassotalea ponticola TaxID=1523392 RepID=UPI0025B36758|nr:hypothetical protein [Thalassotalea ponticola]MDN3651235.1 hypothetical protein [Thalassotalea ponticola]
MNENRRSLIAPDNSASGVVPTCVGGLGDKNARLRVYCANAPQLSPFDVPRDVMPLNDGDIHYIGQQTSNHWRKIFNVYAKLVFDLLSDQAAYQHRWQHYRERTLLQQHSHTALLFAKSYDALASAKSKPGIDIIMGKTYAYQLLGEHRLANFFWPTSDFAIDKAQAIIVCPYFDYRQLTNEKIGFLQSLIHTIDTGQCLFD